MDSEETIEQDADMFPELNGHTSLQDKINAERAATENMNLQQTDSASEELSSDEYSAVAVVTAATVEDAAGNVEEASSTIQLDDLEITLNDQSEFNDVAVDSNAEMNDNSQLEPANKDQPELANNDQPGILNFVIAWLKVIPPLTFLSQGQEC